MTPLVAALNIAGVDPQARMAEWWMELPEKTAEQWLRAAKIEPTFPLQPWTALTHEQQQAVLAKIRGVVDIYRASKLYAKYHIIAGVME